ncbi:MAG TPA: ATP-binding protein [bacterium]|nr:ATP-binding protein [bacterium]
MVGSMLMERITLPREAATPRRARHYLAPRLSDLGMPPKAAAELLVAVGEAVTNAVIHGGPVAGMPILRDGIAPGPDGAESVTETDVILVELVARGDRVAVAVTNPGPRWHVPEARLPADPLASNGRGLYLMRKFTDSVRIDQNRRGTTVYLIRRLRPDAGASAATPRAHRAATRRGRRQAG